MIMFYHNYEYDTVPDITHRYSYVLVILLSTMFTFVSSFTYFVVLNRHG